MNFLTLNSCSFTALSWFFTSWRFVHDDLCVCLSISWQLLKYLSVFLATSGTIRRFGFESLTTKATECVICSYGSPPLWTHCRAERETMDMSVREEKERASEWKENPCWDRKWRTRPDPPHLPCRARPRGRQAESVGRMRWLFRHVKHGRPSAGHFSVVIF